MASAATIANPIPFPSQNPVEASSLKPWQLTVIRLLAQGRSIAEAMRRVGLSEDAYYKARTRQSDFHRHAEAARALHRVQVADDFHDADAFARTLVDSIQRDETLPPGLRLRAALAILNRKSGAWLPQATPALEIPPDTLDILDNPEFEYPAQTADNLDSLDTVDTLDTLDIADFLHQAKIPGDCDEALFEELTACFSSREIAETFFQLVQVAEQNGSRLSAV